MKDFYRTASDSERDKDSSCVIPAIRGAYGFDRRVLIPLATARGSVKVTLCSKFHQVMNWFEATIMSDTNPRTRRYVATGIIYLALVASVFGFNVIRARTRAAAGTWRRPAGADRRKHEALFFADDEPHLFAERTGANVGELSECRPSRLPRLSGERPKQVFQAARQSTSDG